jgi:hypothetical protein
MKLSRDDFGELFEIACRGQLASAFYHTQVTPTLDQWQMLRGHREITMRDMGEISFATTLECSLNLSAIPRDEKTKD